MLALSSSCRYFVYRSPADMRFGINSLADMVRNQLGSDPMSGEVFVFLGKRGNQVRLLQWDTDVLPATSKSLSGSPINGPRELIPASPASNSA